MISFRFHIVSIIAVFLALAIGIGMGVTVIDKATVDLLQARLDTVRNEVAAANQRSDALERQQQRTGSYEKLSEEYLVSERLANRPVVTIAVRGIDEGSLNDLHQLIQKSGAAFQGTIWLTPKVALSDTGDVTRLRQILGATDGDVAVLRQALITRLGAVIAGTSGGEALKPLVDNGFLDWQADRSDKDIAKVTFGGSLVVVASSATASVPNEQLAVPLTRFLAAQPAKRLVAVEPGREADGRNPAQRAVFLQPLRDDSSIDNDLSTVDDIETSSGRVATVIALSQLSSGRTGHYGVASSADGQIPKLTP